MTLVARDQEGNITTARYDAVNATLLNESLKRLQRARPASDGAQQQIEALAATSQKVREQVVLSNPASQLVANP